MSAAAIDAPPLLRLHALGKRYRLPRTSWWQPAPMVQALDGVDLEVRAGTSLGIVGESGSGKSTLARLVMALEAPTAGSVCFEGHDLHALPPDELRAARAGLQMVFQDPYGSLDPRRTVGWSVAEPLRDVDAGVRRGRVAEALDAVGLQAADTAKYPHEFSGGQRQRIAIARALITRPKLIVADEPVSALDVSVQAQVLNLMADLAAEFGVTYLFISHDLAVVHHVCEQVAVLREGRVVERGATAQVFAAPRHAYTRALLDALPEP
jgi:peptide/nickel transport system ATP-binding protein